MRKTRSALFAILLLALFACCPRGECYSDYPSTDRLPLGDWSYNAMASLAADGLAPGLAARVFQGDRLFNRMEMADAVASTVRSTSGKRLNGRQTALLDKLVKEFRPELNALDPSVEEEWRSASAELMGLRMFVVGQVSGMSGENSDNDGGVSLTGFANLSGRAFSVVTFADDRPFFFREEHSNTDPDKAFMRGYDGRFSWSVGREYMNWGPSYLGSLILSDNSGPFMQARGVKDIHFGKFLGRIKVTQFAGAFRHESGDPYLLGRRYEKPLSERWHLGIGEIAKTTKTPNPLIFAMPLYLYQYIFLDDVDAEYNALYSADVVYRPGKGQEIYAEWMVDDMTSRKIFGSANTRPRKTGITVGYYLPGALGGDRFSSVRAEYTSIDRQTYEATRESVPELAYVHNSLIIGHPTGPNSNTLYLRGEKYLSDRLSIIGEYLNRTQKDPGPPLVGSQRMISMQAAYDITPGKSLSFRVAPFRISKPGEPVQDDTLYEVRALFAF